MIFMAMSVRREEGVVLEKLLRGDKDYLVKPSREKIVTLKRLSRKEKFTLDRSSDK